MRIVIDTNVLLDLWVFADPAVLRLGALLREHRIAPLASAATVEELADVLARPRFGLTAERQRELLRNWIASSRSVDTVLPARFGCSDPQDQKFVDLALSGGASLLATRDRALLRMDRKLRSVGLRVVAPGPMLDIQLAEQFDARFGQTRPGAATVQPSFARPLPDSFARAAVSAACTVP